MRRPPAALALALAALTAACRDPTQVTVAISNDFACRDLGGVSVTVGASFAQLASQPPGAVATQCDAATGDVGDLVIVPADTHEATFALRVVGAVGVPLDACDGPEPPPAAEGQGCIVALRALGFIAHTPLSLPIELHDECIGVVCDPEQTCVEGGGCADANVDPRKCEDGCEEEELLGIGGASGAGGAGGSGAGGSPLNGGECMTASDCGNACTCVELSPGGYRVCQCPPVELTECRGSGCCSSTECMPGQKCLSTKTQQNCGALMPKGGECLLEEPCDILKCKPSDLCIPAGALGRGVSDCVAADCKLDADCTAKPGGACIPYRNGCCTLAERFACAYPPDGCQDSSACDPDEHCAVSSGEAACAPAVDMCPQ